MTSSPSLVTTERDGAIAMLALDNPPVNAMSHALRSALKGGARRGASRSGD